MKNRFPWQGLSSSLALLVTVFLTMIVTATPIAAGQPLNQALQQPGMVISQVWDDVNRDGIQDVNESGIAGVTVSLLTCEGAYVMSRVTGGYGAASFEAEAGCYRLLYEELDGYRYCPNPDGINDQTDSDVDPSTRLSVPFEITAGSYRIDIDAGVMLAPGSQIGDRVWHDQNANGIQDIGEPGLPGVSLDLLDCGGNAMRDEKGARVSVASDAAGNFLFDSLTAGCYRVAVTAEADDLVTTFQHGDPASDSDIEPDSMQSAPFDVMKGDARYDLDVGLYRLSRLGDRVWLDHDKDGIQGAGETGMAGVLVLLLDASGIPTGITATTNSNGYYSFGRLRPGDYRLQYVLPKGYVATAKNYGASDADDSDANSLGVSDTFTVASDQKVPDLDFGLITRVALGLAMDKSTNGDDADEPPGPYIEVGADITWNYVVTNIGDQSIFDLVVTDDQGVVVTCPINALIPGGVVTCTGTGTAIAGPYLNIATAEANDGADVPMTVTAEDPSNYFGSVPNIQIRKTTNGVDADTPPQGPTLPVGSPVNWDYRLENTGNVRLTNIAVVDDQGVVVTCPFNTLEPGVSMNCTGSGTAVLGPYANVGTVTATPPVGAAVTASDPSHYLGAAVGPMIEKFTNGVDADTIPGPTVAVDEIVTWTYEVTNDTPFPITDLIVTDNQGVVVVCPQNFLAEGQTIECTGTGMAVAGQYANVGTACGKVDEQEYCDADPSHYFGADVSIDIEKSTNGVDADTPTGPTIAVGSTVTWTYTVTNTGNVTLFDLVVSDDQGVAVSCPTTALIAGDSIDCTGTGTAVAGQYANQGTACANDGADVPTEACDTDPSHYFGADVSIDIEKSTNGVDADTPTGPTIAVGSTVTWTYTVTNTGNVTLFDLVVSDDQGVAVSCPTTALIAGDSIDCTGTGTAVAGQYANQGTACANDGADVPTEACDTDPSHYFGADVSIDIEKSTNGVDADTPTGPTIAVGSTVTWTYTVTNTGNVTLFDLVVSDDQGVAVSCPTTALIAGASIDCTGTGTAVAGQYANQGTACANDGADVPTEACDTDPSHYFGADVSIDIEKSTNGVDADTPTGPTIAVGSTVTWTYTVTNTGNVTLFDLVVTDDQGVAVTCPTTALIAGASIDCTGTGTAVAGQYANLGTACANDGADIPTNVCDEDPSHYFGADVSIDIEKSTNGVDADTPTGPTIAVGGTVTWTYTVTNTGNVTLFDLVVSDDQGVAVSCPTTALIAGASIDCTGTGTAVAGQYANLGTACANDGADIPTNVCDEDPSHYFGADVSIDIEKSTNGVDADTPTGPTIAVGGTVTWTYTVTNTGNVTLFDLVVTDNQGVAVSCPTTALIAGASIDCTGTGTAVAGQYANLGTACANDGADIPTNVCDEDPSHYFGADVSIDIEKSTNGVDADTPTGPTIAVGGTVTWTYTVTNTGNVTLFDLVVTDNQGVAVTCPTTALAAGASIDCTGTGTAVAGQYANLGTACANDGADVPTNVCDEDPSHYFGADVSIDIEKSTNGVDADTPTGPTIAVGSAVTWTYTVTNTGNVTLFDLVVTDNQGVAVTCPTTALAAGASIDCTGTGTAVAGQYANLGTACANDGADVPTNVCDEDPSHYFGADVSIDIEKSTNGVDADTPTGPTIAVGSAVTWTYTVTNTGNVTLFDLVVTDNQGVAVTCPTTALAAGASIDCTGTGTAVAGQYANLGTACANDGADIPTNVCDEDPSHYFGADVSIDIEKSTNGVDADTPTGPTIAAGGVVTWTYTVTNTGNVTLFDLVVTDNQGVAVSCPTTALIAGASIDCTGTGTAVAGQYANLGTACANDGADVPTNVCDEDPSHYFGADVSIDIEKSTNGVDADTPTGPTIAAGGVVTWTYTVTNTGNVTLFDLVVTDNQGVAVSCPTTALAAGASIDCTGTGTAVAGQYANLGTACANDGADVPTNVCDEDPSHYFGADVSIDIEKSTNGVDADTPTGPTIAVGGTVTWTYTVTNTGNVTLFDLVVTDNQGVAVTCPTTALAAGASIDCTGTGTAVAGQYANLGTACANDGADIPTNVCDEDPSHYFGADVSIDIEKSTNGVDADTPTGPTIAVGSAVTWTYTVTNTGNVTLFDLVVTDNQGVAVTCPTTALAAGASIDCTGTGTAVAGQYANLGTACANDGADIPTNVCDEDPSHYFGADLSIDLEKSTNGVDADTPTGPAIMVGDAVTWTYTVTNTGNVTLFDLTLSDDQGVAVTCPAKSLAPGASIDCSGTGIAALGQYANIGMACANGGVDVPSTVCDDDPSHYFGVNLDVQIIKYTNGADANNPPGPVIAVGDPVTWTYEVTNIGNVTLFDLALSDDQFVMITCPVDSLAPGATTVCTGNGFATLGQYMNVGAVCANDGAAVPSTVCDDDPSHYFGAELSIDLEKSTNGVDADAPTGPAIMVGDAVTWTYTVTNTGNVTLFDLTLSDDQGVVVTCPATSLAPGASIDCSGTGIATLGQYANVGMACANGGANVPSTVCDEDPSHYFGVFLAIDLEKATNGVDADTPTGPMIPTGDAVTWTYVVTNIGNVTLFDLTVTDDQGVVVTCPVDTLAPGASTTCTGAGTAAQGQYANLGTACGNDGAVMPSSVCDEDPSHYFGLACEVSVDATCLIPTPPATDYECNKPIDSLTFIWDGAAPVRIKAWKGSVGSTLLADIDHIAPGDEVTVNGFAGSPNNVWYELFTAGSNSKIGESQFHLSCSDDDMDGPEDCGVAQGNGKDDNNSFINNWLLEGIIDDSGTLDCTPPSVAGADSCSYNAVPVSCDTIKDLETLTLSYTGGSCADSQNSQGDKFECSGTLDGLLPALVEDDNGNRFTVNPGESFTVSKDDAKMISLSNAGGTMELKIHTSCSQPLIAGDVYGALSLRQINGMGPGTDVIYGYKITNNGVRPLINLSVLDIPLGPVPGVPAVLNPGEMVTLFNTAFVDMTTTNTVVVDAIDSAGAMCAAEDMVTVSLPPPPPCDIIAEDFLDIDHDKIKWNIENVGASTATIESITITWPEDVHGDLKEIKLDGDTFFKTNTGGGTVTLGPGDWTNDIDKRQIDPGDIERLEFKFEGHNHGEYGPDAYAITVNFAEGCMVMFVGMQPPCDVAAEGFLDIDKEKIKWNIENVGASLATIESITISWPEDVHGDLQEVKLGGDKFFDTDTSGGTVTLGPADWIGTTDKRQLDPGDIERLEFKFDEDNNGVYGADAYAITVNFAEGCAVTFVNTGAPFACDKPIREVSMIWDGTTEPIRVKAWKGNVGSDLLLDQSGIAVGDKVSVAGLAGSPNDVYWEIFSGGTRIGTSKFHLSCSDDDMDGAEDCGKREGNGKSDDAGFINDWLLDGMVDQVGTLDCTP